MVVGSLRRDEGGPERFLTSLAEVWTHGTDVDWSKRVRRNRRPASAAADLRLPARALLAEGFDWRAGDMASAGQASADHPLLGAAIALADDRGWLFTGRLSQESHPWLSDHVVMGTVLLPGTAFLELAFYAGSQVGCGVISELTLEAPLVLPEQGAVQLQLSVGEPDEDGQRPVGIYSRSGGGLR